MHDSLGHLRRAGGPDGRPCRRTTATSGPTTLDDPERLARFVSFVNAPDAPDPSVRFVPERDQIKPDLHAAGRPGTRPSAPWKGPPPDDHCHRTAETTAAATTVATPRSTATAGSRSATLADLTPGRGVAALLPDGRQAAALPRPRGPRCTRSATATRSPARTSSPAA